MRALIDQARRRLAREKFHPSRLGAIIHPFYIIRRRLARAIAGKAQEIEGRVLDFGCGSQPYRGDFAHVADYVGVDVAVSGHSQTNSKVDIYYDGRTLPFPDASFDAVISFEVFEHVFNLDEILDEIRRVLKPGGKLLFSIPFAWDEHEQPFDYARYTSFGIRALLERHGYGGIEIEKTSTDVEAIGQLWIAYLHQHIGARHGSTRALVQLALLAPLTIMTLILSRILPDRRHIYCNLLVSARST
jgi:SAM-dependent methyltransferase